MAYLGAVPFPLEPANAEREKVELVAKVNVGTNANPEWEKRYATVPMINRRDKELIAGTVLEFKDAMTPAHLNLSVAKRFPFFGPFYLTLFGPPGMVL